MSARAATPAARSSRAATAAARLSMRLDRPSTSAAHASSMAVEPGQPASTRPAVTSRRPMSTRREQVYRSIGVQNCREAPDTTRWRGPAAGKFVVPAQYMRMAGGMTSRHNEKNRLKYKTSMIPEAFDMDGDGEVDEWEMKMRDYMAEVTAEDMDGDGDVDDDDLRLAREACGKKMIAENFIEGLEAPLYMYDRALIGKTPKRLLGELLIAPNFAKRMKYLRNKERLFKAGQSHLMKTSLRQPVTTRKEHRPLEDTGFFKDTRATAYRERIKDSIFRRDKMKDFCRNKGDIPTYGNFSHFKHIACLNHVNLAATGH